jgi:hypothetical protein
MSRAKKPVMGRPKLPRGEAKGRVLSLRLTRDEERSVDAAARVAKVKVSEWARSVLLNAATSAGETP